MSVLLLFYLRRYYGFKMSVIAAKLKITTTQYRYMEEGKLRPTNRQIDVLSRIINAIGTCS